MSGLGSRTLSTPDARSKVRPIQPGLSWPLFAEDAFGPATPRPRIDLISTRGADISF
jgi:hypothetical protein